MRDQVQVVTSNKTYTCQRVSTMEIDERNKDRNAQETKPEIPLSVRHNRKTKKNDGNIERK